MRICLFCGSFYWAARFGTCKWILTSRVWKPLFLLLESTVVTSLQTWRLLLDVPKPPAFRSHLFSPWPSEMTCSLSHISESAQGDTCASLSLSTLGPFSSSSPDFQLSLRLTMVSSFLPTLLNNADKKLLGSMFIKVCIENHSLAGNALRRECNLPTVGNDKTNNQIWSLLYDWSIQSIGWDISRWC